MQNNFQNPLIWRGQFLIAEVKRFIETHNSI